MRARRAPPWCSRPAGDEMYPAPTPGHGRPGPGGAAARGRFRPGFFGGVLTVVLKLFQLAAPGCRGVRPEGRAAAGADPADGRRPRPRRGDRRRRRPCATRTGWPSPAGTPTCRPPSGPVGAGAAPRAGGRGQRPRPAARPRCSRRPGPCSTRPRPPTRRSVLDYLALADPATFRRGRRRPLRPGAAPRRGPGRDDPADRQRTGWGWAARPGGRARCAARAGEGRPCC